MNYDPHSGAQMRFERTDRTGRWSPIAEDDAIPEPKWMAWIGGAAIGLLLALMLWASI